MNRLFKIEVLIKINATGGRTLPVKNGYRPGFNFINQTQTSGSIKLLEAEELKPGQEGKAEVLFLSDQLLGVIQPGKTFRFYEGPIEIGNGKVIKVLGWV